MLRWIAGLTDLHLAFVVMSWVGVYWIGLAAHRLRQLRATLVVAAEVTDERKVGTLHEVYTGEQKPIYCRPYSGDVREALRWMGVAINGMQVVCVGLMVMSLGMLVMTLAHNATEHVAWHNEATPPAMTFAMIATSVVAWLALLHEVTTRQDQRTTLVLTLVVIGNVAAAALSVFGV